MAEKVFIADPALKDHRGHHFSLTKIISESFVEAGYEVVWLTHKTFELAPTDGSIQVGAVFSESTYESYKVSKPKPAKSAPAIDEPLVMHPLKRLYKRLPASLRSRLSAHLRKLVDSIRSFLYSHENTQETDSAEEECESEKKVLRPPLRPEQELYRGLRQFDCTADDIVLFHTCDVNTYKMIYEFFMNNTTVGEWNKFPIFHLSTPYDELVMPHNRTKGLKTILRRLGSLGVIGQRVFLYAENELLANHLNFFSKLPFVALPIPLTSTFNFEVSEPPSSTVNVVYLGAARTEKGFTTLPEVVEEIVGKNNEINFILQASPQIMGYTPDVEDAVNRLLHIEGDRLTLIKEVQSPEQYQELLGRADIILLCYDEARYRVRSSGIAVEAIINEALIVATQGTFTHHVAQQSGVGIKYGDTDSIVAAIRQIAEEIDEFRAQAKERKKAYLSEHSTQSFVGKLASKGQLSRLALQGPFEKYTDSTPWKSLI